MENHFTSTKFYRAAINTHAKALTLGLARVHGSGIPPLVYQMKEKNPSRKKDKVGTLKVAVLKGDSTSNNLLALSTCDSKPVFLLLTALTKSHG